MRKPIADSLAAAWKPAATACAWERYRNQDSGDADFEKNKWHDLLDSVLLQDEALRNRVMR